MWVLVSLLIPVVLVVVAQQVFDIQQAEFFAMMQTLSGSAWAIPITIAIFCGMAFIGAPQWMLITGTALISQGLISGLSGSVMAVFFAGLAGVAILLSWLAKKRLEAKSPL